MNFTSTKILTGTGEYFETADRFFSHMPNAWQRTKSQVLKMETRQKYVEFDNPSWEAWIVDNDWQKAMRLLEQSRTGDVALYQNLREKGVDFVRCRPVIFPLSDYMKWEFEIYKFNEAHGERIFCFNDAAVPSFTESVAEHDFMVFDATSACIHNYDAKGKIIGGWWINDQRSILELRLIPFNPAAQDVVLQGLPIYNVLVLFRLCQPDGKMTDRCPAKRSTRVFPMRKRVRGIWRNVVGLRASSAPLAASARAGL